MLIVDVTVIEKAKNEMISEEITLVWCSTVLLKTQKMCQLPHKTTLTESVVLSVRQWLNNEHNDLHKVCQKIICLVSTMYRRDVPLQCVF